jgi:hypothetical protein
VTARSARAAHVSARQGAYWPFAATSPWNMPLGSGATYESSDATQTANLISTSVDVGGNMELWSHPMYVARATDSLCTITNVVDNATYQYRIPSGAQPAGPSPTLGYTDAHMHVVDPSLQTVHEGFRMEQTGSTTWTTHYKVDNSLTGSGVGSGGVRAYGGSAIGGLIRKHEIANRYIPHAVAIALDNSQLKSPYVWPASDQDFGGSSTYAGQNPMGTLCAIPPSVNLTTLGLNADALALATALQNYGAYVTDRGSQLTFYLESGSDQTKSDAMRNSTALSTIRAQLRVVTNNSSSNPGGPGTRRVPYAPRLVLGP